MCPKTIQIHYANIPKKIASTSSIIEYRDLLQLRACSLDNHGEHAALQSIEKLIALLYIAGIILKAGSDAFAKIVIMTENPPFSRPHPYGALIRFPRGGGGMLFLLFIESRKNLCLLSVLNSSHSRTCVPENLRACGVPCECNGVLYAMTDEEYY
ncbi:hypothetical protein T4E_4183 [Trichinella pseudospiralis]|uniref:Uncharacterized protein n=1 Tax=Trichinella pseudospiralis TaxID=6337 RepID=A0A0V0YE55_TRIPS|nr:hypothetical protein T4E_4183 [Trichinella pseudospiralis]